MFETGAANRTQRENHQRAATSVAQQPQRQRAFSAKFQRIQRETRQRERQVRRRPGHIRADQQRAVIAPKRDAEAAGSGDQRQRQDRRRDIHRGQRESDGEQAGRVERDQPPASIPDYGQRQPSSIWKRAIFHFLIEV